MLTLAQFATAVGAPKRWVQNAFRVLGLSGGYSVENARRLALARTVKQAVGLPLRRALPLAGEALAAWPDARTWSVESEDGAVTVIVDLRRFLSDFHARLSLACSLDASKRRGRPARRRRSGVAWAREHGVDIGLLEWSLARTPQERLKSLDQEVEALKRLGVPRR